MRVILATGNEQLNKALSAATGAEVAAELYYREALATGRQAVDVAVVSTELPGQMDLPRAVLPLRLAGTRVVVVGPGLSGPELDELLLLGVYDLLLGDQPLSRLTEALRRAATLGEALQATGRQIPPAAGGRILQWLRDWRGRSPVYHAPPPQVTEAGPAPSADEGTRKPLLRPLVAVWAPLSTGRTFVAAELAVALGAGGVPVLLVDLDLLHQGLGARLLIPDRLHPLRDALAADPLKGPVPRALPVWQNVWAYADSAGGLAAPEDLLQWVLEAGTPDADWCLADLPGGGPLAEWLLPAAHVVVFVAEPDWGRLRTLRSAYQAVAARQPVLAVINRWVPVPHASPQDVLGIEPDAVIPFTAAAYAASVHGRPAQEADAALRAAFDGLARALARKLPFAR